MSSAAAFVITYWGTTGTLSAPLKPVEVTSKLRAALEYLRQRQMLEKLIEAATNVDRLAEFVHHHLPFELRASYGGNTTCVEIQTPDALLVVDCGSGFRELGVELQRRWKTPAHRGKREAHIILTHPHMDHTFGTPYFDPYYDSDNTFTLYGSETVMRSLDAVLNPRAPLSTMYFAPTFDLLKATIQRSTIDAGQTLVIGSTTIKTMALKHPGGCLGFRFDCAGRSFVFCTDHEHDRAADMEVADFARDADLLYLDAQYLAEEYEGKVGIMEEAPMSRRGWGHSTVESCVSTAVAANVRQLHLGHREPKRDDADLTRVERHAQALLARLLKEAGREPAACSVMVPWEGLTVRL